MISSKYTQKKQFSEGKKLNKLYKKINNHGWMALWKNRTTGSHIRSETLEGDKLIIQ